MSSRLLTALAVALGVAPLSAQSFNLDFGDPLDAPASSYGAAGLPGYWNALRAANNVHYALKNLAGVTTTVDFRQFGGPDLITSSDPSVSGDDALLMNDGIVTHTPNLDSCFYFYGLQPGTYELITYAWRPDHPTLMSKNFVDNTPGVELSGGAWPGSHVRGVTYARHIVTVGANGFMGPHSGLAAGADSVVGAVCNGLQLRKIEHVAFCFGDGSGNPCPCGNPGQPGRGCNNHGAASGGAQLSASGLPSLASDGVTLSAVGENASALTIFWTGRTLPFPQGVAHGAGLRCVSGLSRLYSGSAFGGAIARPGAGDSSVSARSASVGVPIAAGETRYYFTVYRDPRAVVPCGNPASGINVSNAVAVSWIQ